MISASFSGRLPLHSMVSNTCCMSVGVASREGSGGIDVAGIAFRLGGTLKGW